MLYAKKNNDLEIECVNNCAAEELATAAEVMDYMCAGGEISEGKLLELADGYIYIDAEEMDFYPKSEVCKQILIGILETYV